MAIDTGIDWADDTVNPVMGCDGCGLWTEERKTCYAGIFTHRKKGQPGFPVDFNVPTMFAGRTAKIAQERDLSDQIRNDKLWLDYHRRMIFVSSMGDALSLNIPFEFLKQEIIDVACTPHGMRHDFLWLSKRPARMAEFSNWCRAQGIEWPVNVWAGTTVFSSATLPQIDHLRNVGNDDTIRFLSVEPQDDFIDFTGHLDDIAWLIQGGESGATDRPFDLAWARHARDVCRSLEIPYFLKQLGKRVVENGSRVRLRNQKGEDWAEWPEDLLIRQVPWPAYSAELTEQAQVEIRSARQQRRRANAATPSSTRISLPTISD